MKNPTAEDVLKKTFEHLDEIIEEGCQDSGAESEHHPDTANKGKHDEEAKQETAE